MSDQINITGGNIIKGVIAIGTNSNSIMVGGQEFAGNQQENLHVFNGNITHITSNGENAKFHLSIKKGDNDSLKNYLIKIGLNLSDASELVTIVASEGPGSRNEPLGSRASLWLVNNLKKAADGTWKVGISVATDLIKNALLKYYGL